MEKAKNYGLWVHILARSNSLIMDLSYKHIFLLHKMLIDGLEWWGLLVDYCDVFISCLDSHYDGTHSLQRIHWSESDATFLQICSDEETNSSTSWMAWGQIFIFGRAIPLMWLNQLKKKCNDRKCFSSIHEQMPHWWRSWPKKCRCHPKMILCIKKANLIFRMITLSHW